MKIILTGSTGFIGYSILTHSLSHPLLTSLVVLSRRPLPPSIPSHPKLKVILVEDFTNYNEQLMEELKDAEGCIWALGGKAYPNPIVEDIYTMAAAENFAKLLTPQLEEERKKFRFVYCSGTFAVVDQEKSLWFMGEGRRVKGRIETSLAATAKQIPAFESIVVRPAIVLPTNASFVEKAVGSLMGPLVGCIGIDELAAAMVDLCVYGDEKRFWENEELVARGKRVLDSRGRGTIAKGRMI